jgi:cyclase
MNAHNTTKRAQCFGIAAAGALFGLVQAGAAPAAAPTPQGAAYPGTPTVQQQNDYLLHGDGSVRVWPVRQGGPNETGIYMLVGAGANITVQVGANGVLLVNSGKEAMGDKVLAALRSITRAPLRTIIATDASVDSIGGNVPIGATGQWITGGDVSNLIGTSSGLTAIVAAQEVLERVSASGGRDARPAAAWPTDTYTSANKDIWFNGESIRLYHAPSAHTDGDTMVYFRHSDVVSAGDVYSTVRYPVIDLERGGSLQGTIDALNRLIYEVMIPGPQNDGGTVVIPNYGHLSGYSEVVFYQEMLIVVRDRIQGLIDQKKSLAQVLAADTTLEFDPRYGATTGEWTTTDFVTAAYKSLVAHGKAVRGRTGSAR